MFGYTLIIHKALPEGGWISDDLPKTELQREASKVSSPATLFCPSELLRPVYS